jgi:hypothetical protein
MPYNTPVDLWTPLLTVFVAQMVVGLPAIHCVIAPRLLGSGHRYRYALVALAAKWLCLLVAVSVYVFVLAPSGSKIVLWTLVLGSPVSAALLLSLAVFSKDEDGERL